MKQVILMMLLTMALLATTPADSQQVSVHVNISSQPLWGPVGYDYVEYYYIPSCEVYYSVPDAQFIYLSNGRWIYASYLPGYYGCDLFTTYKVVINKPKPWLHHSYYVVHYAKYSSGHRQVVIRDSKDPKYFVVKGHPQYTGAHVSHGSNTNHSEKVKAKPKPTVHKAPAPKKVVEKKANDHKKKKEIHS